jgi:hypothetical protein
VFTFGVLLLCGMGLWSIGFLGPTWVKFQSSDGEWADSEILTKGRRFEDIATLFELYRSKCNSAASLQRTTRRPSWFTFEHWFNDYSEPKWLVPYAEGLPKTASGHYPEASANHCANRPAGWEEPMGAEEGARSCVAGLAQQSTAADVRNARR